MELMKKIILASGSPRRRELLAMTGLDFDVFPVDADESIGMGMHPEEVVKCLANRKAHLALKSHLDALIIGADTIVALDGMIFGKPENEEEAFLFLERLSGKTHQVYTGITLAASNINETFVCCTSVTFFDLSEREIRDYVASGEPLDKAGAYGIQGLGRFLVEKINGSYDNVVGLPIAHLCRKLKALGILSV